MEQGTAQQQPGFAAPRLRPLDVGQKLDAAIKLTTRNFKTLALIVLLIIGPIQLLTFLLTLSTLPEDYTVGEGFGGGPAPEDEDISGGLLAAQLVSTFLLWFASYFVAPAACFKAIAESYLGHKATWGESLAFMGRRLHSVLWVALIVSVAVAFGFLFVFLPGIWLIVAFSLAVPALMVEGIKGFSAVGRSFNLITGHWWRTFGALLLGFLLTVVISFMIGFVFGLLMFAVVDDSSVTAIALNNIANLVAQLATLPFFCALLIVIFFDLRIRKEGFDLQLLAQSIGGRTPTDMAPTPAMPWVAPPGWAPHQPWGPQPGQAGWGQPQPGAPAWGQPQGPPPQGWGQPQAPPQQGWGQPQAPPQGWGQPQAPPQGWGQPPQAPPQQGWDPPGQRWEPPAPPHEPPPPPQQWEPPAPPGPPDPPDRSSSE